jgi:hypothetical protein
MEPKVANIDRFHYNMKFHVHYNCHQQAVNPFVQYLLPAIVLLDVSTVSFFLQGEMINMKIQKVNFSEILSNYPAQHSAIKVTI